MNLPLKASVLYIYTSSCVTISTLLLRGNCNCPQEEEEKEKEEEEKSRRKESVCSREDVALKEMTVPTATEAQEQARARAIDKQEQLCKISRALAVLASASVRMDLKKFWTVQYLVFSLNLL